MPKPDVNPKNLSNITATCLVYNLIHLSGQLVKFEELYSNFSDFNLKYEICSSWNSQKYCYKIDQLT